MGAIRISLFLSIAFFALLSIGIANATGLTITSNSITTPIDYPQNAIYTIKGISGGVLPYTFNAYFTNTNTIVSGSTANNVFLGSNTFSPSGAYNAIIITINSLSTNSISIIAYNGIVSTANTLFSNTIITTGTNTIYGAWTFNAFFADYTGANTISSSNTLTINPALSVSISPTSNTLDANQALSLETTVSGGTPLFTINYALSNSLCGSLSASTNTLSADGSNTIVFTANSALNSACSTTLTASVTDSANTPVTESATSSLTVNPKLGIPTITPAATNTLDENQPITITATVSGGTSPYTYTFIVSNELNPSNIIATNTVSSSGPESFVWTTNAIGTFVANVIVTDSANVPETTNSAYSANIVVNPTPTITLTPSNTVLDSGQTETYKMQVSGGTGPFNVELYNVTGSKPAVSENVIISSSPGSNTISFIVNSPTSGNTFTYNAIATDIGTTTPYVFSSTSNTITVDSAPYITLTATPSNSIMYGRQFTVNALISGGSGAFAVYWYLNGNSLTPTIVSSNTMTSNTMTLPAAGSYVYMVEANDIGTTYVYKLAPATNTIIVAQNNTLSASASGNPGSSYYGYPVTITFTGTPTIHHQAKWSLYVNGALYGTTNSTIIYYDEFAPPGTYNFVFNLTSDANYTPYTYKTSLSISYPPTGAYGVNTTVTTVTTTSTTTSIPTTSVTTTIPPSQKALNITSTISSSSPLVLSLPNTHSTLSIYTTSTASTPIVANIANVTQQVSSLAKPQPNYTLINAVNVSIKTTAPITAFFVEHYPCSIPSDLVAPYIFKNNTWLAITNYTVNATACTVSFYIPSDPIVAIFEKSVPTTTTTSIATTIPTTIPTTIYYPSPSPKPRSPIVVEALILIIILIIIILVLLYYYKFLHRRYHGFKR